MLSQLKGGLPEMSPRGGFGSEDAAPPFGDLQVHLEHPALRPDGVDGEGERNLDRLADEPAARPEEQIARDLHRDGAGTSQPIAALPVFDRILDGDPVDAVMKAETIVFGGEHRARKARRDGAQRHRPSLRAVALDRADDHEGSDRRIEPAIGDDDAQHGGDDGDESD